MSRRVNECELKLEAFTCGGPVALVAPVLMSALYIMLTLQYHRHVTLNLVLWLKITTGASIVVETGRSPAETPLERTTIDYSRKLAQKCGGSCVASARMF